VNIALGVKYWFKFVLSP